MTPRAIVIKAACLIGLLVWVSPAASAQPGQGNLVMAGQVRSEDGSPAAGIRVVCTLKDTPNVFREAQTDEQGKWSIPFIKKGIWVVAACAPEKMSELRDVRLNASTGGLELVLTRSAADIVIEAKNALYREDYPKTAQILEWFIQYFPKSRERAGALFWLAYANNRLGVDEKTSWLSVNLREKALKALESLIRSYPASEWTDDAEILRIDVALGLYQLGQRGYRKIIEEGAAVGDRPRINVKIAGLEALMGVDGTRAVRELREVALKDPDPAVRKNAVLVLGQSGRTEALAVIGEVAAKDPDASVRKAARIWAERRPPGKIQ